MSDQVSFGCPYDLMYIVLPCRVGQTLTGLPVSASSVNALSFVNSRRRRFRACNRWPPRITPPVRYDLHHNLAFNASRSGQIEKVSDASASGSCEKSSVIDRHFEPFRRRRRSRVAAAAHGGNLRDFDDDCYVASNSRPEAERKTKLARIPEPSCPS